MKYEYYRLELGKTCIKYLYRIHSKKKFLDYYDENKCWKRTSMTYDFIKKHYKVYNVSEVDAFLELL